MALEKGIFVKILITLTSFVHKVAQRGSTRVKFNALPNLILTYQN